MDKELEDVIDGKLKELDEEYTAYNETSTLEDKELVEDLGKLFTKIAKVNPIKLTYLSEDLKREVDFKVKRLMKMLGTFLEVMELDKGTGIQKGGLEERMENVAESLLYMEGEV